MRLSETKHEPTGDKHGGNTGFNEFDGQTGWTGNLGNLIDDSRGDPTRLVDTAGDQHCDGARLSDSASSTR